MVTIRDVADRAGVSATTVSHVINKTRPVSDALSKRVLAAMGELGYQPNALARSLRRKQTHTFGLIVPDSANPFFAELARGIEDTSFDVGYSVILCNSNGDPARERLYLDVLATKQVDGILLVAAGESTQPVDALRARDIPVVIVDRDVPGLAADCVLTDNAQGGRLATEHLIALGHRRIGCIAGPADLTPSADRVTGYRQALQAAGISADETLIVRGDFRDRSGYQGAQQLLALADPPTAMFACNDLMAIGAVGAVLEHGWQVPDDISIIGFDDIHLAAYVNPPLTTVAQPKYELGAVAAAMLLERLGEREMPPRRRLLVAELVVRRSAAICKTARTAVFAAADNH